ncbi:MAG: hypothetical protein IPI35_30365 [Deltaproteobacteria bacterium]|nr:hypothetical protein [Deltaproteobacteria bacterium]
MTRPTTARSTGETGDTYVPWPDDTAAGTDDDDGDGFTVEDGDCDDADVYVNPGRSENEAEEQRRRQQRQRLPRRLRNGPEVLPRPRRAPARRRQDPRHIVGVDDFGDTDWEVLSWTTPP